MFQSTGMIKYIGSKRVLVPTIRAAVEAMPRVRSVADLFSGTSRVGHALKQAGFAVHANDATRYAHALAACYVQADRERVERAARTLIDEFNALPGSPGYFTHTFCERSRFFQPFNGERIDAIRDAIARKSLEPELEAVCLVSLMEAADRVDSTTGVQMAYLKKWAPRSRNPVELRLPDILPAVDGVCTARCDDARAAAAEIDADLAYIDPPYNQHAYLGNYHIWETLVRWDKPETYGIACKRTDCRERKSDFNSRRKAFDAFRDLITHTRAPNLMVSFSSEGFLSPDDLESVLAARGDTYRIDRPHPRYIGHQIGVFNPAGERVGTAGPSRNTEFIYVVLPEGQAWNHAAVGAKRVTADRLVAA